MGEYLTGEEVKKLIALIKSGDNEAWESLYHNFERYVHDRAWNHLRNFCLPEDRKKDMEEELYQAGWQGFLAAVRTYDPKKGEFLTYATHYIDGEMRKERNFILNPLGFTERVKADVNHDQDKDKDKDMVGKFAKNSTDADSGYAVLQMPGALRSGISVEKAPDRGRYSPERRVLQIMEILRLLTDEEHSLSKDKLGSLLHLYRVAKYHNGTPLESPNTLTSTIEDMLTEVNPLEYTDDNDGEYKIRYEGYRENRLSAKKSRDKGKKKAADITGFSYVHTFDRAELDSLIQLICFSDMISNRDKQRLVGKLVSTASVYYRTPFQKDEEPGDPCRELKFNPKAIHNRFSGRILQDNREFSEKINLIQQAVKDLCQIRFKFNGYTADHEMVPKSEYLHVLSPYHLVVYHDNYYCIGLKKENKRIWHYRVDLMSDVEILTDSDGKAVPIDLCAFEGLPICNAYWDPEKYMAEHLYMAYDDPKEIHIKIRNTDYTILHDWFGNHYEKTKLPCEAGYDIVKVRTSPSMIVHWAMQYAGAVEVMDEEIREEIRIGIKKLKEKYG